MTDFSPYLLTQVEHLDTIRGYSLDISSHHHNPVLHTGSSEPTPANPHLRRHSPAVLRLVVHLKARVYILVWLCEEVFRRLFMFNIRELKIVVKILESCLHGFGEFLVVRPSAQHQDRPPVSHRHSLRLGPRHQQGRGRDWSCCLAWVGSVTVSESKESILIDLNRGRHLSLARLSSDDVD